jgi:DNA polymerase-3 subunit delta'
VVGAATLTPLISPRRVFVIERAGTMNAEATSRLLKTLEEPAPFAHFLLLCERAGEVAPTIRSRCRFMQVEPRPLTEISHELEGTGVMPETATMAARLAGGDADEARELASERGRRLLEVAMTFAGAALAGDLEGCPWEAVVELGRDSGKLAEVEVEDTVADELEFVPAKERKRTEREGAERARRARRRAESAALERALRTVTWSYRDLLARHYGAVEVMASGSSPWQGGEAPSPSPPDALRAAIELVDSTRERLRLNVGAALALEALAYRLAGLDG